MKCGVRYGLGIPFPKPNFVKYNRIRGYIPLLGKLIPKIPILAIWGAVGPYVLSHNNEIWHEGADLGLSPQAKFGKIA